MIGSNHRLQNGRKTASSFCSVAMLSGGWAESLDLHLKKAPFLVLSLLAGVVAATEPVYVTLDALVDPVVEKQLAQIQKPKRTVPLPASEKVAKEKRVRRVHVVGSLSDTDVYALLEVAAVQRARLSMGYEVPWEITIRGNATYAKVSYKYFCGNLCGSGADIVFVNETNGWRFLYTGDKWVS